MPGILSPGAGSAETGAPANDVKVENGVQVVSSTLEPGRYPAITVSAGTPVKWVINAPEGSVNGCNNRMIVSEYGIEHTFKTGENVIEFTPTKTGKFKYSCWMGMIRGTITVEEAGAEAASANTEDAFAVAARSGGPQDGLTAADSSEAASEARRPAAPAAARRVLPPRMRQPAAPAALRGR